MQELFIFLVGNQYFINMVQQLAFVKNTDARDVGISSYFILNNFFS